MDLNIIIKNVEMMVLVGCVKLLIDVVKQWVIGFLVVLIILCMINVVGESVLGDLIVDLQFVVIVDWGVVIVFMNFGGICVDLNVMGGGIIVIFGDVYVVQFFGNMLVVMDLIGVQIKVLFEQQFDNFLVGQNCVLQVSKNFIYSYDSMVVVGNWVDLVSIKLGGVIFDFVKIYCVIFNFFFLMGGDNFIIFVLGINVL